MYAFLFLTLTINTNYIHTGESEEERECNTNQCPDWTPWSEWSQCTKSCGGGMRTKLRECVLLTR